VFGVVEGQLFFGVREVCGEGGFVSLAGNASVGDGDNGGKDCNYNYRD